MADLNQVFLLGNLTRDPEVRYAPSGDAVADMHMAVSRRYRSRDGQDREETCFVSVVVWGRQAEPCGRYLHKGSLVLVDVATGEAMNLTPSRQDVSQPRWSPTGEVLAFLEISL